MSFVTRVTLFVFAVFICGTALERPARAEMTPVCRSLRHAFLRLPRHISLWDWPAWTIKQAGLKTLRWKEVRPEEHLDALVEAEFAPWILGYQNSKSTPTEIKRHKDQIRIQVISEINSNKLRLFATDRAPLSIVQQGIVPTTIYKVLTLQETSFHVRPMRPRVEMTTKGFVASYVVVDVPDKAYNLAGAWRIDAMTLFVTNALDAVDVFGNVYDLLGGPDVDGKSGGRTGGVFLYPVCNVVKDQ